jgi:hypothetical protein
MGQRIHEYNHTVRSWAGTYTWLISPLCSYPHYAHIPIIPNKLVHYFTLLLGLIHTLFSAADNYALTADKLRLYRHTLLVPLWTPAMAINR